MPSASETGQSTNTIEYANRDREKPLGVDVLEGIERKNVRQIDDMAQLTEFLGEVMPGVESDIEEFKKFVYLHVRNYIEMDYVLSVEKDGHTPHVDTFDHDMNTEKLELLMTDKRQFCLDEISLIGQESAYDDEERMAYQLTTVDERDGRSLVDVYSYDVISDLRIRSILSKDANSLFNISKPDERYGMINEFRDEHTPLTDQQIYGKLVEMSAEYQVRFAENGYVASPDIKEGERSQRYDDDDFSDILSAASTSQEKPIVDLNKGKIVDFSKYGNKPIEQFSDEEIFSITQEFRSNNQLYENKALVGSASIDMEAIFDSVIEDIKDDKDQLERIIQDCEFIYGETWVQDQLSKLDAQFGAQQTETLQAVEVQPVDDERNWQPQNVRNLARRALDKLKIW